MAPCEDKRCKGLRQRKDFLKGFRSDDAQENAQYLQYNNKLINARVIDEIFSNANPHRQPASHRAIELVVRASFARNVVCERVCADACMQCM